MTTKIVLSNHAQGRPGDASSPIQQNELEDLAAALAAQLCDVASEWSLQLALRLGAPGGGDVAADESELAIFDTPDVAGAGGYHATDPRGRPYGKVFVSIASSLFQGPYALSMFGSHEAGEMAGDLPANLYADRGDGQLEEAHELSDRVEDTGYQVTTPQGTTVDVSNFLLPPAFDPGAPGPFDALGVLQFATDMTAGGYAIVRIVGAEFTLPTGQAARTPAFGLVREKGRRGDLRVLGNPSPVRQKLLSLPSSRLSRRRTRHLAMTG